tara:strand:- start:627 stop:821 length:195 start_codon:yes stop_codon:yes gene_type:complete
MTNTYDVLSQLHTKATGSVEESVKEELTKEDPPVEEARAILEAEVETEDIVESGDEDTEGDDGE